MHDGFYLRASVGVGITGATLDDKNKSGDRLSGFAASLDLNLLVGGSPSPGLAVGGALVAETASVGFERDDFPIYDRSASLFIVGPFVDGYPNPSGGWHFGGTIGFAHQIFGSTGTDPQRNGNGVGGAFWLGHDFWMADDWSLGPLLKLGGAATKGSDPDTSGSSFSASLLFTGVYH